MRLSFPWKRRKKDSVYGPAINPVDLTDMSREAESAENARHHAEAALRETRRRTPEVARVVRPLEGRLSRNHWAEMMEQSFQRKANG